MCVGFTKKPGSVTVVLGNDFLGSLGWSIHNTNAKNRVKHMYYCVHGTGIMLTTVITPEDGVFNGVFGKIACLYDPMLMCVLSCRIC